MTRRVLVTGAEGVIGTAVRDHLGSRYELTCLTLTRLQLLPVFRGVKRIV